MLDRVHRVFLAALFAVVTMLGTTVISQAMADSAGTVRFVRFSEPSFDRYLEDPSPTARSWLNTHIWRMGVYAPYFNAMTAWYPNGWLYKDAYALYTDQSVASQKPDWVLRDASGAPLYIKWGCSNGTCPQYAANISSRAFRQWWISNARAELATAYRGLFVDDVNMEMQVSNGHEEATAPIDPSTGQPMTAGAWRAYMATFMQEVRAALPGAEIVHNVIWFSADHAGAADPSIRTELSSANYVYLERGVNDAGLTGGRGSWSVNALLSYIDEIHALGRGVVLDGAAGDPQGLQYNLAAYFLLSTGNDAVSGGGQTPESWWAGWSASLGEARAARYTWNGLLRRDFTGGTVLLNPPGAPTRTVSLSAPMRDIDGNTITSVTLAAASGAVLRARPESPSETIGASSPTRTVLETVTSSEPTGPHRAYSASARRMRDHRRHGRAVSRRARSLLTRVHGVVLRATRGRLTIEVEQSRGHDWARVRHLTVAVERSGHFARLLQLRAGTRYRVRAVYNGAPGYRPSRSAYRVILPHAR
jgi:hypothetical protein